MSFGRSTVTEPFEVLASTLAWSFVGRDRSTPEFVVRILHPADIFEPVSARATTEPLPELMSRPSNRPATRTLPFVVESPHRPSRLLPLMPPLVVLTFIVPFSDSRSIPPLLEPISIVPDRSDALIPPLLE